MVLEKASEGVARDLRVDRRRRMLRSAYSGLVGAAALTAAHEGLRRALPNGPRMDRVGQRGLARLVRLTGNAPPRGRKLYRAALAGDLALNGLFYGLWLAGETMRPWRRGLLAGARWGPGRCTCRRGWGCSCRASCARPPTRAGRPACTCRRAGGGRVLRAPDPHEEGPSAMTEGAGDHDEKKLERSMAAQRAG